MPLLIPRIISTARLKGITGSVAEREMAAHSLKLMFKDLLIETFEKNSSNGDPVVYKTDIKEILGDLIPNIKIGITSYDKKNKNTSGSISNWPSNDYKAIVGYILKIPFTNENSSSISVKDTQSINVLAHEVVGHLFKQITEPKYPLRFGKIIFDSKRDKKQWEFYKNVIYRNELEELSALVKNKSGTGSFSLLNSLKTRINKFREKESIRGKSVEKKVKKFFKNNKFSPQEKIEVLQKWRYGLKDEIYAYKAGCCAEVEYNYFSDGIYINTIPKNNITEELIKDYKNELKNLQKTFYTNCVERELFLPQKLKIIEKTLINEYAKAGHDIKAWSKVYKD